MIYNAETGFRQWQVGLGKPWDTKTRKTNGRIVDDRLAREMSNRKEMIYLLLNATELPNHLSLSLSLSQSSIQ